MSDWMVQLSFPIPDKEWLAEQELTEGDYVVAAYTSTAKIGIKEFQVKGDFSGKLWLFINAEKRSRFHLAANSDLTFVGQIIVGRGDTIFLRADKDLDGGGQIVMRGSNL